VLVITRRKWRATRPNSSFAVSSQILRLVSFCWNDFISRGGGQAHLNGSKRSPPPACATAIVVSMCCCVGKGSGSMPRGSTGCTARSACNCEIRHRSAGSRQAARRSAIGDAAERDLGDGLRPGCGGNWRIDAHLPTIPLREESDRN
jgi:hypothetical protein